MYLERFEDIRSAIDVRRRSRLAADQEDRLNRFCQSSIAISENNGPNGTRFSRIHLSRLTGRRPCHPVSNDAGPCQGVFSNTSPRARRVSRSAISLSRKGFDDPTKASFLSICAVDAGSHHPSLRYVLP